MTDHSTRDLVRAQIETKSLMLRGERVMLDEDMSRLYGVETYDLNRAVNRNPSRFPEDFAFRLSPEEAVGMRRQIGAAYPSRRNDRHIPRAFTELGAVMLASVLKSRQAVAMSIHVSP